jgi:hypothetical protein
MCDNSMLNCSVLVLYTLIQHLQQAADHQQHPLKRLQQPSELPHLAQAAMLYSTAGCKYMQLKTAGLISLAK